MCNGNLIKDRNKEITNITYNHLNLPTKVTFEGTNKFIEYLYTATGQKVQKMVKHQDRTKRKENVLRTFLVQGPAGALARTRYLHGFQYYDNVLQFFHTPEGYVKNTIDVNSNPSFDYIYQYKDHLGNVRVNYAQNPKTGELSILEEAHYYPFGLQHTHYNTDLWKISRKEEQSSGGDKKSVAQFSKYASRFANPGYNYKFGGKEQQSEFGVEMYDFGARNYDPALGRWMNVDPMAELAPDWTPYRYAFNNPLRFTDPTGMFEREAIQQINVRVHAGGNSGGSGGGDDGAIGGSGLDSKSELLSIIDKAQSFINSDSKQDVLNISFANASSSSESNASSSGGGCEDCNMIEKIFNSIFSYTVDTNLINPLIVDEVILDKGHANATDEISSKLLELTRGAAIGAATWKLNKFFSALSGGASTFLNDIDINYTINYEVVEQTMWEGNYTYNLLTNKILNINTKNTYTVIFNRVTSISDGNRTMNLNSVKVDPNLKKLIE